MPSNVPCVFCGGRFSWSKGRDPMDGRLACDACSATVAGVDGPPVACCRFCGKADQCLFSGEENRIARALSTCFKCAFWIQLLTQRDAMMIVTPKHEHYTAEYWGLRSSTNSRHNGFGGSPWRVTFLDGSVKVTNNLWFQGEIPDVWRAHFEPNVIELRGLTVTEAREATHAA